MSAEKIILDFNGTKVHVYRRERSSRWQCSVCLDGENFRESTKETNLASAKAFAEEWYLRQRLNQLLRRRGETLDVGTVEGREEDRRKRKRSTGPVFKDASDIFLREYPVLTQGQRNALHVKSHEQRINSVLIPFFGDAPLHEAGDAKITELREHLAKLPGIHKGTLLSRSSIHKYIVTARLVFKTAKRHKMIVALPDMSEPYKKSGKVKVRPWFSRKEYDELVKAARERAKTPLKERWREQSEDMLDLILFAANTGLRPDELVRLQVRDVEINTTDMKGERILHIAVSDGKRGFGNCKSMPGAVHPFEVLARRKPEPGDLVFPSMHRELFNDLLDKTNLKATRDGQRRSLYSLRHTYICLRLIEGADVYNVAKNCRTSVQMIESNYASHIRELIDVDAVNVRKAKSKKADAAHPA